MFLLRLFFELDALAALFVIVELAVPVLRDKPKLPITRWILRTGYKLLTSDKPKNSLLEQANTSLGVARERLKAAEADLVAAETEQRALRMENRTNDIREKGDEE